MKAGRNDPCPCGSGKKYKKCCMEKDEAAARQAYAEMLKAQAATETQAPAAAEAAEEKAGEPHPEGGHNAEAHPTPPRLRPAARLEAKGGQSRAARIRSKDFAKRWATRKRAEG